MKKILLCAPLLALLIAGFIGCSQNSQWNSVQRETTREALRNYRQMVYLNALTDAEFIAFTDNVALALENKYPAYATFTQMPGVADTVDMVIVTTIIEQLNADARNMKNLYPYPLLVSQGVLPSGLNHDQQKAFYSCLASKVNSYYNSMDVFFKAIITDTINMSQIGTFQQQCANELFSWTITEVEEIVETN